MFGGKKIFEITEAPRRNFNDIVVTAFNIAILDMAISGRVFKQHFAYWWHYYITLGICYKSLFDFLDGVNVLQDFFYLIQINYFHHELFTSNAILSSRVQFYLFLRKTFPGKTSWFCSPRLITICPFTMTYEIPSG
ncbi:hypothetical protein ES708_29569 [subsurface metagenome]